MHVSFLDLFGFLGLGYSLVCRQLLPRLEKINNTDNNATWNNKIQ